MFHVRRHDPRVVQENDASLNSRKRQHEDASNSRAQQQQQQQQQGEEASKPRSSLRTIAENQNNNSAIKNRGSHNSNHNKKGVSLFDEAFDDLGIDVDSLIEDNSRKKSSSNSELKDEKKIAAAVSTIDVNNESNILDLSQPSINELKLAKKLSKIPLDEAIKGWKLAPFLIQNLLRDGFNKLFPIQCLVIPDVISSDRHSNIRVQDVCVTAPTGSGKTLSFVLPILNSLACNKSQNLIYDGIRRLQALVILPNRDLAMQVYDVFESYMIGSSMKVGLAVGQSHFASEQKTVVNISEDNMDPRTRQTRISIEPDNLRLAMKLVEENYCMKELNVPAMPPKYGCSNVDVLVCTPGRLIDHLDNTPGFTLQHLRFLVVDEADRLLSQSYNNWIDRVMEASNTASIEMWNEVMKNDFKVPRLVQNKDDYSYQLEPITWRRGALNGDFTDGFNTNDAFFSMVPAVCQPVQLRKFLVSATLTKDPKKLAALRLVKPKHFNVHLFNNETTTENRNESTDASDSKKYSMPEELDERFVECTSEQKPLVLLSLILERLQQEDMDDDTVEIKQRKRMVVVFTSSVDSTHRLTRLLQLFFLAGNYGAVDSVAEFSSLLKQTERSAVLERANDATSQLFVVVCSDGLSRGMDIQYVDCVINYDVPSLSKTYVHRCGRTARASRKGTAVSLLTTGQLHHFQKMRKLILYPEKMKVTKIKKNLVANIIPKYRSCLKALQIAIVKEEDGELNRTAMLTDIDFNL